MKKRLLIFFVAALSTVLFADLSAQKKTITILNEQVEVKNPTVKKQGEKVYISMFLDLSNLKIKSNSLYTLVPTLQGEGAEIKLPAIQLVGRKKNIYLDRNPKEGVEVKLYQRLLRKNKTTQIIKYAANVPHEEWMDNSYLMLNEDVCGCAMEKLSDAENKIRFVNLSPVVFSPVLAYVRPEVEEIKRRNVTESVYLEFKVNKTNIEPSFRQNQVELAKVNKFVSDARADKNISIQNTLIHGYASPDGPYDNNDRLSRGRAESMMNYLKNLYGMTDNDISVAATAEDWKGLRERVLAADNLQNKDQIVRIIDGAYAEDPKEKMIKTDFPHDYNIILNDIYPYLRRSDCVLDFIARNFNLEEAKEVFKTNPVQLSLNEMYLVAETYQTGSDEFNNIFEVAARLFPDDAVANLNVANTALIRGDLIQAKKFLKKAPACPETDNAKGVVEMLEENLDVALKLLEKAKKAGVKEAEENIRQIHMRQGLIDPEDPNQDFEDSNEESDEEDEISVSDED